MITPRSHQCCCVVLRGAVLCCTVWCGVVCYAVLYCVVWCGAGSSAALQEQHSRGGTGGTLLSGVSRLVGRCGGRTEITVTVDGCIYICFCISCLCHCCNGCDCGGDMTLTEPVGSLAPTSLPHSSHFPWHAGI